MISCWIGRLRGSLDGLHDMSQDDFANSGKEMDAKLKLWVRSRQSHHTMQQTHVSDLSADPGGSDIWF